MPSKIACNEPLIGCPESNRIPNPFIVITAVLLPVPDFGYVSLPALKPDGSSASLAIATIALPAPAVSELTIPTLMPRLLSELPFVESCEKALFIVAFKFDRRVEFNVFSKPGKITNLAPVGGINEKIFPMTSLSCEILPILVALAFPVVTPTVATSSGPGLKLLVFAVI